MTGRRNEISSAKTADLSNSYQICTAKSRMITILDAQFNNTNLGGELAQW